MEDMQPVSTGTKRHALGALAIIGGFATLTVLVLSYMVHGQLPILVSYPQQNNNGAYIIELSPERTFNFVIQDGVLVETAGGSESLPKAQIRADLKELGALFSSNPEDMEVVVDAELTIPQATDPVRIGATGDVAVRTLEGIAVCRKDDCVTIYVFGKEYRGTAPFSFTDGYFIVANPFSSELQLFTYDAQVRKLGPPVQAVVNPYPQAQAVLFSIANADTIVMASIASQLPKQHEQKGETAPPSRVAPQTKLTACVVHGLLTASLTEPFCAEKDIEGIYSTLTIHTYE